MQRRAGTTLAQIIRGDTEARDYDIAQLALFLSMEVKEGFKISPGKEFAQLFSLDTSLRKVISRQHGNYK